MSSGAGMADFGIAAVDGAFSFPSIGVVKGLNTACVVGATWAKQWLKAGSMFNM